MPSFIGWEIIYGAIFGVHASIVIALLTFTLLTQRLEKNSSFTHSKIYLTLILTVFLFAFGGFYLEHNFSDRPILTEHLEWVNIGKITQSIATLLVLYVYNQIFNIKISQPNHKVVLIGAGIICALCCLFQVFTNNPALSLGVFILQIIAILLIITYNAHFYLKFSPYRKNIRNAFLLSSIPLIILFYFAIKGDGTINHRHLLTGQLSNAIFMLILSTFYFLHSRKTSKYIDKVNKNIANQIVYRLQQSIADKSLYMVFQPQVLSAEKKVAGFEALIRWNDTIIGAVSPSVFIPIAEMTKLIDKITLFSAEQSILHLRELIAKNYEGTISVNLSAKSLKVENIKVITKLLKQHNVPPHQLIIEITESSILKETLETKEALAALEASGCLISLDDYGTGYSSLNHLNKLKLNELKIDASFIKNICSNKTQQVIVETTLAMGEKLGISIVAEGVEDKETFDLLKEMRCDIIQGYYIAKPMNKDESIEWIEQWQAPDHRIQS